MRRVRMGWLIPALWVPAAQTLLAAPPRGLLRGMLPLEQLPVALAVLVMSVGVIPARQSVWIPEPLGVIQLPEVARLLEVAEVVGVWIFPCCRCLAF